ncbi:MAG: glycogen debranching protein GlgX [Deltaproteobacteria bacterium]|nr:glycogen debranching protein GlgX [Deltaproteobacteria bacterium]
MQILAGKPNPLGATFDSEGVNFAVYSENALAVDLCLFSNDAITETHRISMQCNALGIWHTYIRGIEPGQLYGYRASGPYAPNHGHRFNPHKLLIDPYTRAIDRPCNNEAESLASLSDTYASANNHINSSDNAKSNTSSSVSNNNNTSTVDTAHIMPKSVVINPTFDWQGDTSPNTPWNKTIIYECHVKGFTMRHPDVPPPLRGTYLGLSHPVIIDHLKRLGVTAVQLLPIQQYQNEPHLIKRQLNNYWGYNTVAFFAPELRYASAPGQPAVNDFKTMVQQLHHAGIEIILDVVFNHTAEGGEPGQWLSMRGLDNAVYYHLDPNDHSRYRDYTGCGNSLNLHHPRVLQFVVDCLRYWKAEMHVDGFRFDLTTTLCRDPIDFKRRCHLLGVISQDPVLAQAKLIAEPWDVGYGGYQLGQFPNGWAEWNDKYRDTVRRFWRGDDGQAPELASRITGSSDLFPNRSPQASINFITAHDGFTLLDLVSYDRKHNDANGENNHDGFDHNFSHNWGIEGPTNDPQINLKRQTAMKNMLATLLLSQGVPMLSGGDELARTQNGNNNAYCQDNEISWHDWNNTNQSYSLIEFTANLVALRNSLQVLQRQKFFTGKSNKFNGPRDLTWLNVTGHELSASDWSDTDLHTLGMLINGNAIITNDQNTSLINIETVLLWLNATSKSVNCTLPKNDDGNVWIEQLNTAGNSRGHIKKNSIEVAPFALTLLVLCTK